MLKHKKRVYLHKKYYLSSQILKVIRNEVNCNPYIREKAILKLTSFPRASSKNKLFRHCLLTRRIRGVKRQFYLSRLTVREKFNQGFLPKYYV